MSEFDAAVAIVTGGASGLGAATAALLHERGARVAVFDRDITAVPEEFLGAQCDVTDSDLVEAPVRDVVSQFGAVDVLVTNAGIGAVGDIFANTEQEWHRILDVNVLGIARVTRATLPHLRKSAQPTIVNTSSIVAHVGVPSRALYSASKGAVSALTKAMAADHVAEGIRVNAVLPGDGRHALGRSPARDCGGFDRGGGSVCQTANRPAYHPPRSCQCHRIPRLAVLIVDNRGAARGGWGNWGTTPAQLTRCR